MPTKMPLDVLIVTAVPDEYEAVLQVEAGAVPSSQWRRETCGPQGREMGFREFLPEAAKEGQSALKVGVVYAPEMGQVAAAQIATDLLNQYQVQCLAMCGICAGRRGKVNLGDVIIGDRLWNFEAGKVVVSYNDEGDEENAGDQSNQGKGSKKKKKKNKESKKKAKAENRSEKFQGDWATYQLDSTWKQRAETLSRESKSWKPTNPKHWLATRPHTYEEQELWLLERLLLAEDPTTHPESEIRCKDWKDILNRLEDSGKITRSPLKITEEGKGSIDRAYEDGRGKLPDRVPFQIHVAPMGSGTKVVEDEKVFDRLSGSMRKVLGLEMEASSIGFLQHLKRIEIPYMIVMKAVQDFADHDKNDNFRDFAARASAECLLQFLRINLEPTGPVPGFDDILESGQRERPKTSNLSPSQLLDTRYAFVPFYRPGREDLWNDLQEWSDDSPSVCARLLHGPGGMGKTRLMIEFCAHLKNLGWEAGFLPEHPTSDWLKDLGTKRKSMLIVIDYAESRANLWPLLSPAAHYQQANGSFKIRMVLLARNQGDWWQFLIQQEKDAPALFAGRAPVEVPPLALQSEQRKVVFEAALQKFAEALQKPKPSLELPSLDEDFFERVLYLHMAALMHLIEPMQSKQTPENLMESILDHEEHFWTPQGQQSNLSKPDWHENAKLLLTASTLLGGLATKETTKNLAQKICSDTPTREELRHLHHTYGHRESQPYIDSLQPDLLGEAMVLRVMQKEIPTEFLTKLFEGTSIEQLQRGFEVLGRIGENEEKIVIPWIKEVLASDLRQRSFPALFAARSVAARTAFSPLADTLHELLEEADLVEVAPVMENMIPRPTVSMRKLVAWVDGAQLRFQTGQPENEEKEAERARLLNNQSVRLSELGQREQALDLAQEALEIRRKLAAKNPDAFLPDVATSLNNLGNRQSDLGDREAALQSASEALEIRRKLAAKNPDAFLPDVATSLNNLGNRQSDLGDREAALQSASEALEIYRELATKNPDAFLPDVAMSLNNLGNRQSEMGDQEAALQSASEALEIYRELATKNPDAFLPDVAMSLSNLGNQQSALGDREGALQSASEAVEVQRELAKKQPDAFLPWLARYLSNLSMFKMEAGRTEEALADAGEALSMAWPLFEKYPVVFYREVGLAIQVMLEAMEALKQEPSIELLGKVERVVKVIEEMQKKSS